MSDILWTNDCKYLIGRVNAHTRLRPFGGGHLCLWNVESRRHVANLVGSRQRFGGRKAVRRPQLAHNRKSLVVGSEDGRVYSWNLEKILAELKLHKGPRMQK